MHRTRDLWTNGFLGVVAISSAIGACGGVGDTPDSTPQSGASGVGGATTGAAGTFSSGGKAAAGGTFSGGGTPAAGGSTGGVCASGQSMCGGACVDTDSNPQHCGSCGSVCSSPGTCNGGSCECPDDLTFCSNACVDTETNTQHCGGCGDACPSGSTCSNGTCSTTMDCSSVSSDVDVSSTIVVGSGDTYDGGCKRFISDGLGNGSEDEGQEPIFEIEDGGTLINVVLGSPAADGIHTLGDATLRNITWQDIGEDALTVAGSGTVTLDGGSAVNSADKVFQINAASTFRVSNFRARTAGKFVRQNGGTSFTAHIFIDRCDISDMSESIARTDSDTSTVDMTNTRYSDIGDTNFIGFNGRITESNNTEY